MTYITEGGQKFTRHKIASPVGNIAGTCQVCHRESEEILRNNVYDRQRKVKEIRELAEIELVKAHVEAKAACDAGALAQEMDPFLQHVRNAQWYWDYAAACHGSAFHASMEVSRIMADFRIIPFEETPKVPFNFDGRILFKSDKFEVVHLVLKPGEYLDPHIQPMDVVFFVMEGKGSLLIGKEVVEIPENTTIHVKSGILRAWPNTGKRPLRILVSKLFYITGSSGMMIQATI